MDPASREEAPRGDEIVTARPGSKVETRRVDAQVQEPPVLPPQDKERPAQPGTYLPPAPPAGVTVHIPRRHGQAIAVALLVLGALGASLLYHFVTSPRRSGARGAAAPQPPASITMGRSRAGDINVYVTALGTVTPLYTVTVYSQVTGRVMQVHYREGQMVKQGDPLIDVDARPYQALLTQSIGTLQHDQALLDQARIDLKRYQAAAARNAIPRQQLDDQQQLVYQYQGSVRADRGTVAYNRVQLDYCHIVSPITGRVGLRLVDPGNTVFAGSSSMLVVITQLQPITIVFNVSEDDLPRVQDQLRAGGRLRVDAFDRADEHLIETGTLTSLDNQIDTTTGTIRFRAEFPNQDLRLFPNQFVNARLLLTTLRGVTLVPTAAIQYNGTDAFVYVVRPDSTVAVQPVTTLTGTEQETAVRGVAAGVNVATGGFDRLESGVAVQIRRPPPLPGADQGVGAGASSAAGSSARRPGSASARSTSARERSPPP